MQASHQGNAGIQSRAANEVVWVVLAFSAAGKTRKTNVRGGHSGHAAERTGLLAVGKTNGPDVALNSGEQNQTGSVRGGEKQVYLLSKATKIRISWFT